MVAGLEERGMEFARVEEGKWRWHSSELWARPGWTWKWRWEYGIHPRSRECRILWIPGLDWAGIHVFRLFRLEHKLDMKKCNFAIKNFFKKKMEDETRLLHRRDAYDLY
jgi:hypothetical protein